MIGFIYIFTLYIIFNYALALYSLKKERIKKFTFYFLLLNVFELIITQDLKKSLYFFSSNLLWIIILLIILFLIDKIGGYYEK